MKIVHAKSQQEIDAVRRLFREYETHLDVDLCFQQFEAELDNLPGKYAPPSGTLLLATDGQRIVGCGALRKIASQANPTCEMKRLYVRPEARGLGIGKRLANRLIQEAVGLGYAAMVLDTLDKLKTAIHLYESLGFVPAAPYYNNPLPGVIYLKLNLTDNRTVEGDAVSHDE